MNYIVEPMASEYLSQRGSVGDLRDYRHEVEAGMCFDEILMNEVELAFGSIHQNQSRWAKGGDLPGKL